MNTTFTLNNKPTSFDWAYSKDIEMIDKSLSKYTYSIKLSSNIYQERKDNKLYFMICCLYGPQTGKFDEETWKYHWFEYQHPVSFLCNRPQ